METKQIAIIGGGIAGLSAAYYLHGRISGDGTTTYACTVYDISHRLGGNCYTAYLDQFDQAPFADLGVNDFNADRYLFMMDVLRDLAESGYGVEYGDLIDSTTWYMPQDTENPVTYTFDEMHTSKSQFLTDIRKGWNKFCLDASDVLQNPATYGEMSVATFVEGKYNSNFIDYNLLPRINGMYYTTDQGPGKMPILGVMKYYHLQEGIGKEKTTEVWLARDEATPHPRKYFKKGASDWIRQLWLCLESRGVKLLPGHPPTVNRNSTEQWEVSAGGAIHAYDILISAVYANKVRDVFQSGLPSAISELLAEFQYLPSISIVHTDSTVLPSEPLFWSTYNILIHPSEWTVRPYTITYVCKEHQGQEVMSPPFVSVTPYRSIDPNKILDMVDPISLAKVPAKVDLAHNVVTVEAMQAQTALGQLQGHDDLYFTGGWTNGAGLHEEILAQNVDILRRICGYLDDDLREIYLAEYPDYVPAHIRRTLGEDLPLLPW